MSIFFNNSSINDWNYGTSNLKKVYHNNSLCYLKINGGDTPKHLPSGYTEVEYIRNGNYNAYIDTGVVMFDNKDNSYTITAKITSEFHSNLNCATIIACENPVPTPDYYGLGYRYKCSQTVDSFEFYGAHENYVGTVTYNADGTKNVVFQSTGSTTWTLNTPLILFANWANTAYTSTNRPADASIYALKVVKNNTTVRDYVPAMRNSDGVYGLYDLVNDVFYTSPNGNLFVGAKPKRLPSGYTEVEYVQTPSVSPYCALQLPSTYNGSYLYYDFTINILSLTDTRIICWNRNTYFIGYNGNTIYQNIGGGRIFTVSSFATNTKYHFGLGKKNSSSSFKFENLDTSTTYSSNNASWGSGYFNPLFGGIYMSSSPTNINVNQHNMQIFEIKIYDNDVLVADYIPAIRDSDNFVTMYDLVSEQICNTVGGGSLIAGPIVS